MPDDLYSVLGVARGADKPAIRRAYRRKAKAAHPDVGGSAEKFTALAHAHAVLTDDSRRSRYDATGDESNRTEGQEDAEAMNQVAAAFDEALGQIERQGADPVHQDMVALIRRVLSGRKEQPSKHRGAVALALKNNKKLLGRFTAKTGANFMEVMIRQRIAHLEEQDRTALRHIGVLDRAIALIDRHTFAHEKRPDKSAASPLVQMMLNHQAQAFGVRWG